jgi:hypothetical protein
VKRNVRLALGVDPDGSVDSEPSGVEDSDLLQHHAPGDRMAADCRACLLSRPGGRPEHLRFGGGKTRIPRAQLYPTRTDAGVFDAIG